MVGHFWSFRPQFRFMCGRLEGLKDAHNNGTLPKYTRETQVEYFKVHPGDLIKVPGSKYYPGEEERMEQIKRWLANHVTHAVNGITPKYNGPPDELSEKSNKQPRAKNRPLNLSNATLLDLLRAIIYKSFMIKSKYTMPDFKEYQRLFWYKIATLIQLEYEAYLKTTLPEGEEHQSALAFRNKRARELLAAETEEVKNAVEVSRFRNSLEHAENLENKDAQQLDAEEKDSIIANLGNIMCEFFNIMEEATGWKGIAFIGGFDPLDPGSMKFKHIDSNVIASTGQKFCSYHNNYDKQVTEKVKNYLYLCLGDGKNAESETNSTLLVQPPEEYEEAVTASLSKPIEIESTIVEGPVDDGNQNNAGSEVGVSPNGNDPDGEPMTSAHDETGDLPQNTAAVDHDVRCEESDGSERQSSSADTTEEETIDIRSIPEAIRDVVTFLLTVMNSGIRKKVVKKYVELELENRRKNTGKAISLSKRPKELIKWLPSKNFSKVPRIRDAGHFTIGIGEWWGDIQPDWRLPMTGDELLREGPECVEETWDDMLITGPDGVQQLLIAIAVWVSCCEEVADDASKEQIDYVLEDLDWALTDRLEKGRVRKEALKKRRQRDEETSAGGEASRKKRHRRKSSRR